MWKDAVASGAIAAGTAAGSAVVNGSSLLAFAQKEALKKALELLLSQALNYSPQALSLAQQMNSKVDLIMNQLLPYWPYIAQVRNALLFSPCAALNYPGTGGGTGGGNNGGGNGGGTPSPTPTPIPSPPGCFETCTRSDFPLSIDVLDKTGNIAISYSSSQCKEFRHSVSGQQNPMRVFQDQSQIGGLNSSCNRKGTLPPPTRTNLEWMLDGYAPCDNSGRDNIVTELHHFEQNPDGPIAEMSKAIHLRVSHPERPSRINRNKFDNLKEAYWKTRGYQLNYGDNAVACTN